MNRSESVLTVVADRRNEKLTSTRLVSFQEAFFRALHGRLQVSDGSVYEAEPATVNLLEEIYRHEVPFSIPDEAGRHFRVTYTDDSVRYVSCAPDIYPDSDGIWDFLSIDLEHVHVDGQPATLDAELSAEIEDMILEAA